MCVYVEIERHLSSSSGAVVLVFVVRWYVIGVRSNGNRPRGGHVVISVALGCVHISHKKEAFVL